MLAAMLLPGSHSCCVLYTFKPNESRKGLRNSLIAEVHFGERNLTGLPTNQALALLAEVSMFGAVKAVL